MAMAKRSLKESSRFEMRCSPEELAVWRAAAERHGLTLACYVRACLGQGPRLKAAQAADVALIRQVSVIANSLNQILWWAQSHTTPAEIKLVEKGVQDTRHALELIVIQGGQP